MWDVKLSTMIRVYVAIYVCNLIYIYMIYLLSSSYLRVFGDDRVRDTREQMLLMHVTQVQLSRGEGFDLGNSYVLFISFENNCKP